MSSPSFPDMATKTWPCHPRGYAATMNGTTVVVVLGVYATMSAVSFCAYGIDKWKARSGRWRIPERNLLRIDALGGWPGGLIAQRVFQHKTRDRSFQNPYMLIVLLHAIAWALAFGWHATESDFLSLGIR